ncbi:leucine-rich repeat domain-containing protein [Thetidibacter halocola]|uniref:Leucine-rich repeat domain-containing protein n=1 Tax=Thetidibacter halocola TaxID=2827239 RepID=A0A8J7WD49_9RHOB|nr:leucine-rich repeat domain-containing protein [Thetidibacter halocola]MBS0125390.1 leucine-rich repeat domain-containing protein [Thetidibacter halocola]
MQNATLKRLLFLLAAVVLAAVAGRPAVAQTEVFLVNDPAITDGRLHYPVLISDGRGYRIRCQSPSVEEDVIRGLGFLTVPGQILDPTDPRIVDARMHENPLLCPQSADFPMQLFVATTSEGSQYFLQIAEDFGSAEFTGRIYQPGCLGLVEALNVDLASAVELDPRPLFPNKTHKIVCRSGDPVTDPVPKDFTAWCTSQSLSDEQEATVRAVLDATPEGASAIGNLAACQQATAFLASITTLNLDESGASDLGPLSVLTGLQNLSLSNNGATLVNVGPLADLSELRFLDLSRNAIRNVTGLAPLVNLSSLNLAENDISDIRQLSSLTGLGVLDLSGNTVGDLSPLEFMTTLATLSLAENGLTGGQLAPLAALGSLEALDLSDNAIEDFSILAAFSSAVSIDLTGNPGVGSASASFLDICVLFRDEPSPLGHTIRQMLIDSETCQAAANRLNSVSSVDLSARSISDLQPLTTLKHLTQLNLSGNAITNVGPLSQLTALTSLDLATNSITDIKPIAPLVNLTAFSAAGNPVNIDDYLSACLMRNEPDFLTPAQSAEVQALLDESFGTGCLASNTHLGGVPSIDLADRGLTTLQYVPVLKEARLVKLDNNQIRDVRILAELPRLVDLRLKDTLVDDNAGLETLTRLTNLDLSDTPVERLNFLVLLRQLEHLNIRNTQVRNIRQLANLSTLRTVTLWGLDITYFNVRDYCLVHRFTAGMLGPVRATMDAVIAQANADNVDTDDCVAVEDWAAALTDLNLNRKSISALDPLRHFTSLQELLLFDNNISDITPIANLRHLINLSLGSNKLTQVPQVNASGLKTLYLSNNRIVQTHALTSYPGLQKLNLSDNLIQQTSHIVPLSQLTYLNLMNNKIADVGNAMAVIGRSPYLKGNPVCSLNHGIPVLAGACTRLHLITEHIVIDGLLNNRLINRDFIIVPNP